MDFQSVVTAISTVGFPAVVCIILLYINYKQNEQHKEELTKVTEALNNNTVALTKLSDMINNTEHKEYI